MNWLNLLILILLVAGQTEILAMSVNRLHALPLHRGVLRKFRRVHDVLLLACPVIVFWFLGVNGPALLRGGNWSDLGFGWSLYIIVCSFGTISLFYFAIRWAMRRPPSQLLANHTWTVDVAEQLGGKPVGDGPYRFIPHIPGNQIFHVDVSEKEYRLPRLPREWDGLSILHLTDFHYMGTIDISYFEHLADIGMKLKADLVVFTGDLLDKQHCIDWIPSTLGRLDAPLGRYFILGNHDWDLEPEAIRAAVVDAGWQNVASKVIEIEHRGHRLAIGGSEVPWMGQHPDFSTASPDAFRLLLSHTPDHFEYAQKQRVDLMLSGHNHGGQVVLPIIGPVYGPSLFGVQYAAGVFWKDPTLLYVSRGVSGQHPLRWNCPPEVTKLVLRSG